MLVIVQPEFPKFFAIDIDKIIEHICWTEGIKNASEIPSSLGYDYLKDDWNNWLQQVYPWFCVVHKEEQPEIYELLWNKFVEEVEREINFEKSIKDGKEHI